MDPKDLIIVDYPSLFKPPTPNQSIDSIDTGTGDYFIKLNQAWEEEVKCGKTYFELFKKMYQECERLRWINTIPVSSFHKL